MHTLTKILPVLLLAVLLNACERNTQQEHTVNKINHTVDADILKEGDCWFYNTRPGEEKSFLVIRKIETLPKIGEVIHISVFDVKIKIPEAPNEISEIGHFPLAGASLRASLKEKTQQKIPDVDWNEGYRIWRKDFDAGNAGVFAKPVSDCVGFIETINRVKKPIQ